MTGLYSFILTSTLIHSYFILQGLTGTLRIHGYLRGQQLSVNGLVHIPGWGEYQMSRIYSRTDPYPLERRGKEAIMLEEDLHLLEEANPDLQEPLTSTNEVREGVLCWWASLFVLISVLLITYFPLMIFFSFLPNFYFSCSFTIFVCI